nr:translocation/assembly module TamB [Sphingomonadaceae bacterium]
MKAAIRWIGGGIAALLLIAAALAWIADTGAGHRFIADRIAALAPASGLRIHIGRIDGSIYGATKVRDLRLADAEGVFFEAGEIDLRWSPLKYLANRLDIDSAVAPSAVLSRLPKLKPSGKNGPILPGFDIRIGELRIDRLTIGAKIAGNVRTGRLAGKVDIRGGRALVDLKVDAGAGDRLAVTLDSEPDRNKFDVAATLDAPSGGVFGAMIGTKRAVTARLSGKGTWRDWRGTLAATASGSRVVSLDLMARGGRYDLEGQVAPSVVTQGKLMRLTAPVVRVKGNAMLANRRLDTHLSLASNALAVGANGVLDLGQSAFDEMRVDAHLLRPPALFPNMTGTGIELRLLLDGTFASAGFDYLLIARRAAFDTTGFEQVRAAGRGHLSKAPVLVPLRLSARRVTGVGDVAGGILANLSIDGVLKVTSKLITGDNLRLRSDKLTSRVTLVLDLATGRYDVGLSGQLGRYLIPGLGIVDVKSELRVVPGPNGHGTRIVGRGQAWVRRLDNAFLAGLAGGLPRIDTGLERDAAGIIHFIGLRLTAPSIRLTGNGYRRHDGSFHFEGSGTQARYGPVRLILDGPIDRPHLDLQLARPMDSLGLRGVHAVLDPTAQGFVWTAQGGSLLGPFTGNGAILLPHGSPATIQIARLNASGFQATGALRSLPGGFAGRLALGGSGISGTLDFAPAGSSQRIEAHLIARDAKLIGPPVIAARRGRLDAVLLLDPAGTSVDAIAQAQGLRYSGVSLARLALTAKLRGGTGEVRAAFAGSRGRAFDLQTVAQVSPGRISLIGEGTIDRRPVKLTSPAILTADGAG